jgi:short-subunit dehydrogenase
LSYSSHLSNGLVSFLAACSTRAAGGQIIRSWQLRLEECMTFTNRVIVITGTSDGIGAELARQLSRERPHLVLAARSADRLEAVAADCRARGAQALAVATDVTDETQNRALIERAVDRFGRLDVLVNNAGVSMHAWFEDTTDFSTYERLLRVNFLSSVALTRFALAHLKKTRGLIVGVSSMAGKTGVPARTAYCASKFALGGFFEALRIELAGSGVDVTMVFPGVVATEIRRHGLNATGTTAGFSGLSEEGAMSTEECVRQMIGAMRARRRELVMTGRGKIGMWLKLLAPQMVDRMALAALHKTDGGRR